MTEVDWMERWREGSKPLPPGSRLAEVDELGRQRPKHMGVPSYLLFIADLDPARVRRIPSSAILEEAENDDGEAVAMLVCPCEARPVVGPGLAKCVGCERWYCFPDGRHVFVTYGEMAPPPLPLPLPSP